MTDKAAQALAVFGVHGQKGSAHTVNTFGICPLLAPHDLDHDGDLAVFFGEMNDHPQKRPGFDFTRGKKTQAGLGNIGQVEEHLMRVIIRAQAADKVLGPDPEGIAPRRLINDFLAQKRKMWLHKFNLETNEIFLVVTIPHVFEKRKFPSQVI